MRVGQEVLVDDGVPAEDGESGAVDGEVEPLAPQVEGLEVRHVGDRPLDDLVV